MRFASTQLGVDGLPLVLGLGATRSGAGIRAELIYVAPTSREPGRHVSIPEGPLSITWWPTPEAEPKQQLTVHWPGLTTGTFIRARVHNNLFLRITEEDHDQEGSQEGT